MCIFEREKGARTYRDLLRLYMWIAFVRDVQRKVRRIANAFGETISERQSTMGIYFDYCGATARAYTQAECRSTEAANSFFFSPQLHPRTLHQSPVMAAPRFLSARVYTPAHTRSRRSIYMYIEFIPHREFILRIPSRSFLPEGRLS